jgi:hypothetical protein
MTNQSTYGPQYNVTKDIELRYMKLDHPDEDIGQCSVEIEDTPGFKAGDREASAPDLLEPKICYMWCDDGVRKPGTEDPNADKPEAADSAPPADEKTPLVGSELKGVSPIDSKLDRQGFVIVYNPLEKDSFTAAQNLITDLQAKMAKPEAEEEEEDKKADDGGEPPELPELPPYPFVVVATHADLKNKDKRAKNAVDRDTGAEMAASAGAQFFEVNMQGRNVRKALHAVVSAIHNVESNIVYDKELTRCEKYCGAMSRCNVM